MTRPPVDHQRPTGAARFSMDDGPTADFTVGRYEIEVNLI